MGTVPVLVVVIVAVVIALCRVVALGLALRGTQPADRPAIIRALAEFFRPRIGRRK